MRAVQRLKRGFTLVELMIVVAIVGILAALAIYGVRKYIANAKTAEARNSIGQMAKDASTAFNRENMDSAVLTLGDDTDIVNRLCDTAGNTVPSTAAPVQGKKYQSKPSEWQTDSALVGWTCLRFSMQDPQYFRYNYTATTPTGLGTFEAIAEGDLNGDTNTSRFRLLGKVQVDSAGGGRVVTIAPSINETNPDE